MTEKNGTTKERSIRNEEKMTALDDKFDEFKDELKEYLKKNFRFVHAWLAILTLSLFTSGVIRPEDIKSLIALVGGWFS